MCKYLNPETLKLADKKTKLTLKRDDGSVVEYFIIPIRDPKRSLLIKAEGEEKDRKVWNERTQQEEDLLIPWRMTAIHGIMLDDSVNEFV